MKSNRRVYYELRGAAQALRNLKKEKELDPSIDTIDLIRHKLVEINEQIDTIADEMSEENRANNRRRKNG